MSFNQFHLVDINLPKILNKGAKYMIIKTRNPQQKSLEKSITHYLFSYPESVPITDHVIHLVYGEKRRASNTVFSI